MAKVYREHGEDRECSDDIPVNMHDDGFDGLVGVDLEKSGDEGVIVQSE